MKTLKRNNINRIKIIALIFTFLFLFFIAGAGLVLPDEDWGVLTNGTTHVIYCSHQDIGWENLIATCINIRNKLIINPVLGWIEEDYPNSVYRYNLEYTREVMDYLDAYPGDKSKIIEYIRSGNLEIGATYNCNYESMLPSEALVRLVYLGRKWQKKELGSDCASSVAWNIDPPARAMQMPQIFKKAGINYLITSRQEKGIYNWKSPNFHSGTDDYSILVLSNGKYDFPTEKYQGADYLGVFTPYAYIQKQETGPVPVYADDFNNVKNNVNGCWENNDNYTYWDPIAGANLPVTLDSWTTIINGYGLSSVWPLVYTHDMAIPAPYMGVNTAQYASNFINDWSISRVAGRPYLRMSTCKDAFDAISSAAVQQGVTFDEWIGERPNVWLYIHGPAHHWALTAIREAARLLPAAEMFSTFDCIINGSFGSYPSDTFEEAWKNAIYPDHGWGGNNGAENDITFLNCALSAQQSAETILTSATGSIAGSIKFKTRDAAPIVVFNTLPWERDDPVTCTVTPQNNTWSIIDFNGNPVSYQILSTSGTQKEIVFIAEDVPSLGYKTYYLINGSMSAPDIELPLTPTTDLYRNSMYEADFAAAGLNYLKDLSLDINIIQSETYDTKTFLGGEIFTMYSRLYGAGEFATVEQPVVDGTFYQLNSGNPSWSIVEEGPVRDAYQFEKELDNCTVREKIIFYRGIKKVDFEVSILDWDGTIFREWRMALPVNINNGIVAYEVPMGVVQVGRDELAFGAGERYTQLCKMVHPREVQNFISVCDQDRTYGVTMSSSVAVCDYLFPADGGLGPDASGLIANPILQPVLLATRQSCGEGNITYSQTGDHTYSFSVLSHEGDWSDNSVRGGKFAMQANSPLRAVILSRAQDTGTLEEEKSFCSVSPANIILTAFKKRDDTASGVLDGNVILRMYDIEGKSGTYPTTVSFFCRSDSVRQTNIIEEYASSSADAALSSTGRSLSLNVGHHAIETIALLSPRFEDAASGSIDATEKKGCFIATAAYGTPVAEEVMVLRKFRDKYLIHSAPGRIFVKNYYRYSPPVAEFIKDKPGLKAAVRIMLKPLIELLK
ncbi:MAG: CFI-box-CTERM domain-containing protein [Armatimonadota bacterium]